jgi:hypothetical protein
MRIILAILLLASFMPAQENPNAVFFYPTPQDKVTLVKCDVCGEMAPLVAYINIPYGYGFTPNAAKAQREYMKPYMKQRYAICWKCILKALGVKPEAAEIKP